MREYTCMRKVRYRSWQKAANAAAIMERKDKRIQPYQCEVCDGYHLGKP